MWGRRLAPLMRQVWDEPREQRQYALERLADLTRRSWELEAMPAALRPVSVHMMRRAVFAAY